MKLLLFLIFNIYIISVNGFFYTLLPLTVIRRDKIYKAYCPWNQTKDKELKCKVNKGVMGYFHLKSDTLENAKPEPEDFFNPSLQARFSKDNCKEIKTKWNEMKDKATVCNKYSFCYNVAEEKSVCTCQNGFFGDPYAGCLQHCITDDDCLSPLAKCSGSQSSNQLKRCVCKEGYEGDGVFCKTDVCGADRRAKCGGSESHKVCVPTPSGSNNYTCICETGYFLNHKDVCTPEFTVKENTVITLVGKNIANGSRVELGDCLSFVINDKTKSIFYHKNSGDSIFVRNDIKNENQFSIFFIITKEVTAFSLLKEGRFGLTKLYSMTNTFLGCKFGNARIFDPEGHDLSEADSPPDTENEKPETDQLESAETGERAGTAGPAGAATTGGTGASQGVSALQSDSVVQPSSEVQSPQSQAENRQAGQDSQTQTQPSEPKQDEQKKPIVEVYMRDLTDAEKSGGLSGSPLPRAMVSLASQEESGGLEVGSSRAKSHQDPSHLQVSPPPETHMDFDL